MTQARRVAALLLAAGLALAALGQFCFFYRREHLWKGVAFHGIGVLCFLVAWRLEGFADKSSARPGGTMGRMPMPRRLCTYAGVRLRGKPVLVILVLTGLALSCIATLLLRGRAWDQSTGDAVVLWGLGMAALGIAALWPEYWPLWLKYPRELGQRIWHVPAGIVGRLRSGWRSLARANGLEFAAVAALTALALSVRVLSLGTIPFTLGGDEAWHGLLARQVLEGRMRNPFVMGYMSMPTFFYWPLRVSLRLMGNTVAGARLPAALAGAATVPVLYLLVRDLWGHRMAFFGASLLAAYDYHIHYSRLVANNIWDPLFVVAALLFLDRGLFSAGQRARRGYLILAGLAMGLSAYFYTGARLLPFLTAAYLAFLWIKRRGDSKQGQPASSLLGSIVLPVLACLVAAGPMLGYALAHPDEWNARLNQVGILQSGWLEREPGLTGKSTLYILGEQFLRAAGAFHVFPDRTVWYGAARPLLGLGAGLFALWGIAWAFVHWRQRRYFLLLIWFWSVILAGGMLTESPPSSQRLVIASPAVALFVTIGLVQAVSLARRLLNLHRRWEALVSTIIVLALAMSSLWFYFCEFTPSNRYGSENGETATMIGYYLRGFQGDCQAYFYGAPRIYWNFGTMAFLAPDVQGQDVLEPLVAPLDFAVEDRQAVFLFLPERAGELIEVQRAFPEGRVLQFPDSSGRLRFVAYEVGP